MAVSRAEHEVIRLAMMTWLLFLGVGVADDGEDDYDCDDNDDKGGDT